MDKNYKTDRYIKILKIELEDLEFDVQYGEDLLKKRFAEHKITDYVFMENLSTFRAELAGIRKMEKEIDALAGKYETIEELSTYINDYLKKRVKDLGLPEVVYVLIKRKLDKIYKYLN